jgi:hypothetical protein
VRACSIELRKTWRHATLAKTLHKAVTTFCKDQYANLEGHAPSWPRSPRKRTRQSASLQFVVAAGCVSNYCTIRCTIFCMKQYHEEPAAAAVVLWHSRRSPSAGTRGCASAGDHQRTCQRAYQRTCRRPCHRAYHRNCQHIAPALASGPTSGRTGTGRPTLPARPDIAPVASGVRAGPY